MVQLLRADDVRLAFQEGVNQGLSGGVRSQVGAVKIYTRRTRGMRGSAPLKLDRFRHRLRVG